MTVESKKLDQRDENKLCATEDEDTKHHDQTYYRRHVKHTV